ncbi:MAG: dihydropteroate synthase [Rhodobacteraceae bacterium]|nr:dihydropteroate synthase [Paracoccaceae bacterium]
MIYRFPSPSSAATAPRDTPPLRGQKALRIGAMMQLDRAGRRSLTAHDPQRDAALTAQPAPLAGLTLDRPRIMGIVNVTPDSFSDGGRFADTAAAVRQGCALVAEGADILDIGGESTRPGAREIPLAEEIARIAPVIEGLRAQGVTQPISIDTRKARVAEAALDAGADMVNDVSALTWDPELGPLVAQAGVPICLMHAQGTPQTMQANPRYEDVRLDVFDWLMAAIARAVQAGIAPERVLVDPGIGFGKTVAHNLALIRDLALLHATGCTILLGASRKSFIGHISGVQDAAARQAGSMAVALHGAGQGAQIVRVHDVAQTRQALDLWQALHDTADRDQP